MTKFELALRTAPIGAVLVTYGDAPQPSGLAGRLLRIAYNGIRKHQQALWPDSKRTDGVHIQIKVTHAGLFGGWVSATVPRVVEHFNPLGQSTKARLYRYYADLPMVAEQAVVDYARSMVGKKYDTLQLLGIAASEQKWIPKFMRNWFGERLQLPGRLEVCSTLAHRALLAGFLAAAALFPDTAYHRPLDQLDPFDCTPAHFEHSPTFLLLATQKP